MQFLEICLKTSLLKHGYFGKQMKTFFLKRPETCPQKQRRDYSV
jgi:hypothetical protein